MNRHDRVEMIHSADIYQGNIHYPAKRCFVCPKCMRDIEANGSCSTIPLCAGWDEDIKWKMPRAS